MKKKILIAVVFLLAIGISAQAVVSETPGARGRENAMQRIEENLDKIAERTGREPEGLRRAIERILARHGMTDKDCFDLEEAAYEDEGEAVETLQRFLREKGFFQSRVDGVYGWDTARGLYKYQKEAELSPSDDLERMGFRLERRVWRHLNENYGCEREDEEEKEKEIVYECEEDECEWVSVNCCPENAGAQWECINEAETELHCPEDVACPQVISPKPTEDCECVDGECEVKKDDDE